MTKTEIAELLKTKGVTKAFRFVRDENDEVESWLVKVGKPARIEGGCLVGLEISLCATGFQIWTSQVRKVKALSAEHGMRARVLDGEAVLYVPWVLADLILPMFGGRVKKAYAPEAVNALRQRAAKARFFRQNSSKDGVFGMDGVKSGA